MQDYKILQPKTIMKRLFMLVLLIVTIGITACENQSFETESSLVKKDVSALAGQIPDFESNYVNLAAPSKTLPLDSFKLSAKDLDNLMYLIEEDEDETCATWEIDPTLLTRIGNTNSGLHEQVAQGHSPGPHSANWLPGSWPHYYILYGSYYAFNETAPVRVRNIGQTGSEYGIYNAYYRIEMVDWGGQMGLYHVAINNNHIQAPNYGSSYSWTGAGSGNNPVQNIELLFFNYPDGPNDPSGESLYVTMRVSVYALNGSGTGCHELALVNYRDIKYHAGFDF